MARLSRVFTTAAAALAAITLAGPPARVTPRPADVMGVDSGILRYLFDQYGHDYNTTVSAKASHLYSFDAIDPISGLAVSAYAVIMIAVRMTSIWTTMSSVLAK